jgi:hypothetical protein
MQVSKTNNNNNKNNNKASSSANIVDVNYNKKPPVPVIIPTTRVKKDVNKTTVKQQQNRQKNEASSAKSYSSASKLNKYIVNDTKNSTDNMPKFHSNSLPSFPKIEENSIKNDGDYIKTTTLNIIKKSETEIAPNEIEITLALNENNLNKIKSSSASACK